MFILAKATGDTMKTVLLTATLLLSTTSVMNAFTIQQNSAHEIGVSFLDKGLGTPIIIGSNGLTFNVQPILGNGDCAFVSLGKSRSVVTAALKDAVEGNFSAHGSFDASRSSVHDMVADLNKDSSVHLYTSVLDEVEAFIADSASQYSMDPSAHTPSVLAHEALSDFRSGLGSFSDEQFVSAKRILQSRILNMYYERYEAFQVALKQELMDSGISASKLNTKADLKQSIDDVFAKNTGKSSWLPMGLIFGVQERLGLSLAVWSSRNQTPGYVSLYQFSDEGTKDLDDPSVRHVVWNGDHFDILSPKQ
jgi:hypothetical protein